MKPTTVQVLSTESEYFPDPEHLYPFDEFERIAFSAAVTHPYKECLTEIVVTFDDGNSLGLELFLHPGGVTGIQSFFKWVKVRLSDGSAVSKDPQVMEDFHRCMEAVLQK